MLNLTKTYLTIILLIGLSLAISSCASNVSAPVVPDAVEANTSTAAPEGHVLMGAFTFALDPASGEVEVLRNRAAEAHYNVTDYVLPPNCPDCIGVHFQGIQPGGDIHMFQVNLRNPTSLTVYDVRGIILWDDGDNRSLTNGEAFTKIFDDGGTTTMNPFITFRDIVDPTNAFGPGAIISKTFFINFPKPHNYVLNFIVEGSWPGNSKDPWTISSEDVSNSLDESGNISALISCRVSDHQDDVDSVTVDLTPLGFPGPVSLTNISGNNWRVEITNEYSAGIGHYNCLIEARDATDAWPLYDRVQVVVSQDIAPFIYVDSNSTGVPDGSLEHPYPTIYSGIVNAEPGQIIMVRDGTYIENVYLDSGVHLRGYGAYNPVIAGLGEASIYSGLFVENAIVEHFVLQGNGTSTLYGIHAEGSQSLEFHDIDFVSTGSTKSFQQAVKTESVEGFTLADSRFQNLKASGGAPILISLNDTTDVVLESNLIKNFSFEPGSIFPVATGAVIYLFDCTNVTIKQNLVGTVEGNISQFGSLEFSGVRSTNGSGLILRNNLFYDFHPQGDCNLALAGVLINGTNNYSLEHFTIDNIGDTDQVSGNAYAVNVMFGTGELMINNLLTNIHAPSSGNGYGVKSSQAVQQAYSDVWQTGEDDTYRYNGLASEGVGGLNVNPKYVNPPAGDYHLQPDSPCLTTGLSGAQMGAYGGAEPLDLP